MKFYRHNQVAQEFEMSAADAAAAFTAAVSGRAMRNMGSTDWQAKYEEVDGFWPLERLLRDWLTSNDGLASSWDRADEEGPDSIREILEQSSLLLRARS